MRGFWPDCCSLLAQTINYLFSLHPETMFLDVILRSPAKSGTTKNLMVSATAEILRSAQNDIREFPDGHFLPNQLISRRDE